MFAELVAIAVFVAITMIVVVVIESFRRRQDDMQPTVQELPLAGRSADSSRRISRSLLVAGASIVPQSAKKVEEIGRELRRAGYYDADALIEFLAVRNVMTVGILLLFGSLAVAADPATNMPQNLVVVGLVAAGLGFGLPRLLLHQQAKRRLQRIDAGLPDALDLVSMCLSGGVTLSDALERAGGELSQPHPDVAVEFEIVRRQSDADSMTAALRNFASRIDTHDVRALAAIVTQTEKLGTSVNKAICDFADSIRLAHRQRAEERASKSSVRLLFPVVTCLAPPIFILLCGPPVLKLIDFVRTAHEPGGPLDPGTLSSPEPIEVESPYLELPTERIGAPTDDGGFTASASE